MHTPMFEKIRKFYNLHLYTKKQVRDFADKRHITEEEYIEIVGE